MAYQEQIIIDSFPPTNLGEVSNLTADAAAAQAHVLIENAITVAVNDFCLVGDAGRETTELKKVKTVTGKDIEFYDNLVNKHYRNEPFTVVRGNKAKVYKAPNVTGSEPLDATYVLLTTVTLEGDQVSMTVIDPDGGSNYWYKQTFYNDVTTDETPLANAQAMRGGGYGHYVTVDEVRQEAGLTNNRWIADTLVYEKLIASESEVNASLAIGGYTLPLATVPELVKNATKLLAAGYLLSIDYGPEFNGTNKDGAAKIKLARDILVQIEAGKPLATATGVVSGSNRNVAGYPDNTAEGNTPSEARIFSITDTF